MKTLIIHLFLIALLLISTPGWAKKEEFKEKPSAIQLASTLGSTFLLIGTASSRTVEDILTGVEYLNKKTKDLSPSERNFLFGYAHYRVEEYKAAEKSFKKCKNDLPQVRDYILFYLANIALYANKYSKAASFFEELLSNYADSVLVKEARLGLSQAQMGLGQFENTRRSIGYVLGSDESGENAFEARLLLARSYIKEGRRQDATNHLQALIQSVRDEVELSRILELIEEADHVLNLGLSKWVTYPKTQYDIAQSLMRNYQWNDAIRHLSYAISHMSRSSDLLFGAKWLFARAHFKAHLYKEAVPLFKDILKKGAGQKRLSALQHLAAAYARVDDYDNAIKIREKIIRGYPKSHRTVLDSQWKIAFLLVDEGRYQEAIPAWQKVLSLKGSGKQRTRTLWYLAWSYYQLKDYSQAVKSFDQLLRGGRRIKKIKDRLLYWKARSLEQLGNRGQARGIYKKLSREHPLGYYGVLARRRLSGDKRTVSNFADFPSKRLSHMEWSPEKPPSETLARSPHLEKAAFFDHLKLHDEAAKEIRAASHDFVGHSKYSKKRRRRNKLDELSKERLDYLLYLADRNFAHDVAYVLVHRRYLPILRASSPPVSGFSRFIWEQSYPEAYKTVVNVLSNSGLDPRLVYSVMRAESTFRTHVVSKAGAVGLMQLMPTTAQKMALAGGESTFDIRSLYRPSKNIEYGTRYLKKLENLFPQNTVAMIASYNAGEEAVGRWLKHGYSEDIEEFIEEIPYEETNLYVKKVLRYYWIFQDMYSK